MVRPITPPKIAVLINKVPRHFGKIHRFDMDCSESQQWFDTVEVRMPKPIKDIVTRSAEINDEVKIPVGF